jgi:hypothetical protein
MLARTGVFVRSRKKIAIFGGLFLAVAAAGSTYVHFVGGPRARSELSTIVELARPARPDPRATAEENQRRLAEESRRLNEVTTFDVVERPTGPGGRVRINQPVSTSVAPGAEMLAANNPPSAFGEPRQVQTVPIGPNQFSRREQLRTTAATSVPADPEARCREKLLSKGVYVKVGDPCIDLDELINKLATGIYQFNKPESAYVEEPFRIVLALATAEGQDISIAFSGAEGAIVQRPAPVAQHLEATLRGGADFKVDPPDAQQRTATSSSPVIWEWTVVPRRPGKKTIVIDVAANLVFGEQKQHVQLRTLYEEIQINVGILHWFKSTISAFWTIALGLATMIIAILGIVHYLPTRRKRRHHKPSDEPPPIELVTHQSRSDSSAGH